MGKQYMVYIRVYGISAALLALSSKLSSGSTGSKQFPASFYTSPKCDTPPLIRSAVSVKPHASDTSTACADWYLSAWTAASQQEMAFLFHRTLQLSAGSDRSELSKCYDCVLFSFHTKRKAGILA